MHRGAAQLRLPRAHDEFGGCLRPAVTEIQVHQPNRCNENRESPADQHRGELGKQHHDCVHEEDVVAEDEAHDAFVHEPGIRIEKRVDDKEQNNWEGNRFSSVAHKEKEERRKNQPEQEVAEVVRTR